jgi:septal ring factor EnvC (AmiA/AmiB activator)
MKIRFAFIVFCVTTCLSAVLTMPVYAACQDLNEQIHEHMTSLSEMDQQKEEFHLQLQETDDPTQRRNIEVRIEEIERERDELRRVLGALEREFSECESQVTRNGDHKEQQSPNGDDGFNPLVIAAIIGASGAVLAAIISLLRRR